MAPALTEAEIRARIDAVPNWYHQIEIRPGIVTPGISRPTDTLRRMGLPKRCDGMRVLDIGARDGYFSFELERRGADVVAIDYMDPAETGFPVARELLGSNVDYIVDNVYNLTPDRYGTFDLVLFLGVLYHLRDPLLALDRIWDVCNDGATLAIETQLLDSAVLQSDGSFTALDEIDGRLRDLNLMQFHPGDALHGDSTNYWSPSAACTRSLMEAAGFEVTRTVELGTRGMFVGTRVFESSQVYHRRIEKATIVADGDAAGAAAPAETSAPAPADAPPAPPAPAPPRRAVMPPEADPRHGDDLRRVLAAVVFLYTWASRALSWLRAHPAAALGAIVVLGTLLSWRHTRHVQEWLVMTDELQYLKLGDSFGQGSFPIPTLRGDTHPLLSVLYPLVISPVLALFSAPTGYQLVHLVNAMLLASTAVPVYLLARQVVATRWPAYLAAALALAVPWVASSAYVMTESAAYPAFAWALLAIQRAVAEPSVRRDLVALFAIGVAFYARTQFLFLFGAFPALIALHEALWIATARDAAGRAARVRELRDRLRAHVVIGAIAALGLVLLVLPSGLLATALGPFQGTVTEGGALPDGLGHAMRLQLAYVAGGVGVLPLALALGWALASIVRPVDRGSHAFAVLGLVVGPALVYVVAVFGLRHAAGPLDRYLFYLAPLLIVGTVALLAQRRARPVGLAAGAILAFWLLRSSGVQFIDDGTLYVNSLAAQFHPVLDGQLNRFGGRLGFGHIAPVTLFAWGTLLATTAVWLALRRIPRLALLVVGLPLLVVGLAQANYVSGRITSAINTGHGAINAIPLGERDWVDDALPGDGNVALATSSLADSWTTTRVWWNVEFWNKRINRAIRLEKFDDYAPFPSTQMLLDRRDGSMTTSDGDEPPYMVFGRNQLVFRPQGRVLAEHKTIVPQDPGLELMAVQRPYRAGWIADGGATDDGWILRSAPARIRVFPRGDGRAQRITVRLDLPLDGGPPSRFVLRADDRSAAGSARAGTIQGEATATVCLPPGATRVAQIATNAHRRLPDGRAVGVHLQGIRVDPAAGRAC